MAFMMPVVKNNYPLYGAGPGATTKQQRRTSETDASRRSKSQQITGTNRSVRSAGPSLSTSPGSGGIPPHSQAMLQGQGPGGRGSRPMPMGRARGSAPVLGAHSMPLHRHNSMPHGPQSVAGSAPTKSTSPTRSDSSSSSSEPASPTVTGKFHLKLIARLRRSLRLKDSNPTPTPPEAAATTA